MNIALTGMGLQHVAVMAVVLLLTMLATDGASSKYCPVGHVFVVTFRHVSVVNLACKHNSTCTAGMGWYVSTLY